MGQWSSALMAMGDGQNGGGSGQCNGPRDGQVDQALPAPCLAYLIRIAPPANPPYLTLPNLSTLSNLSEPNRNEGYEAGGRRAALPLRTFSQPTRHCIPPANSNIRTSCPRSPGPPRRPLPNDERISVSNRTGNTRDASTAVRGHGITSGDKDCDD